MFSKKSLWFVPMLIMALGCSIVIPPAYSGEASLESQLLAYAGKTFTSAEDPSYRAYDLVLRKYMVDRIQKRYGVVLDPKTYSGADLLEIESFFKCKKSDEPFEMFLKMFPKYP